MSIEEARSILGVDAQCTLEDVMGRYAKMFEANEKNGSFYLQSKIHRAKERMEAEFLGEGGGRARGGGGGARRGRRRRRGEKSKRGARIRRKRRGRRRAQKVTRRVRQTFRNASHTERPTSLSM